ncbi:MAG: alpha/beta fold hydrolase [Pseudomonas sp.]
MKIASIALFCVLAIASNVHADPLPTPDGVCATTTARTLQGMAEGDFASAAGGFSDAAAGTHSDRRLEQDWSQLLARSGAFKQRSSAEALAVPERHYLLTRMDFATAGWDAISACDQDGRLTYLEWAPASDAATRIANALPATLADGSTSHPTSVRTAWGPLPATLTLPAGRGPFPALVMVSGAGAQDEDASVGPNKPFKDIAEGLARHGIATLRYEKRSRAYPVQAALDSRFDIRDDIIDDALAALAQLETDRRIDARHIYLLGHSLGGMLAPQIALASDRVAGTILMAAPAESVIANGIRQTRYVAGVEHTASADLERTVAALQGEQALLDDALRKRQVPDGSFMGMPQSWWASLAAYDPLQAARQLRRPMLMLQGESDFQVDAAANLARWHEALAGRGDVTWIQYPGLGHPFLPAGTPPAPADYQRQAHVPANVIDDISAWVWQGAAGKRKS